MRLVQFREAGNTTAVAVVAGDTLQPLKEVGSVYALARQALAEGGGLATAAQRRHEASLPVAALCSIGSSFPRHDDVDPIARQTHQAGIKLPWASYLL